MKTQPRGLINAGSTKEGRVTVVGTESKEIVAGDRNSFGIKVGGFRRFVFEDVVNIIVMKMLNFVVILLQMFYEELRRKNIVWTIGCINS